MSQFSREEILACAARGESLRGINLVRGDISGLHLVQADLAEANMRMANLSRADLREARLTGSFLSGAMLEEVNLVGANLIEASLIGVNMSRADLSRADLSGADLTGATLEEAQLLGTYLVGTYMNEADLGGANLSGAYMRMAQMAGCNLTNAVLEGTDLSQSDLSGVRLDGCCLVRANLTDTNLSGSTLTGCDLRGADLTGADLTGCDLTGAKLRGVKFPRAKLDDAWADWVNMSAGGNEERAALEDVFGCIMGKPLAQVLIEGHVSDEVWVVILSHLCRFQNTHPSQADVRLKAIHQGMNSSALYLEANEENSLAAYLAEFADIIGKGYLELFEKLAAAVADQRSRDNGSKSPSGGSYNSGGLIASPSAERGNGSSHSAQTASDGIEMLQRTAFWTSEKAFLILTGSRRVWLEAASSETLTIRPPHGSNLAVDLIHGRFVTEESRRQPYASAQG